MEFHYHFYLKTEIARIIFLLQVAHISFAWIVLISNDLFPTSNSVEKVKPFQLFTPTCILKSLEQSPFKLASLNHALSQPFLRPTFHPRPRVISLLTDPPFVPQSPNQSSTIFTKIAFTRHHHHHHPFWGSGLGENQERSLAPRKTKSHHSK